MIVLSRGVAPVEDCLRSAKSGILDCINLSFRDRKLSLTQRFCWLKTRRRWPRVYTEYLKKAAFAVTAVETGAAALEALRETPPEVVLLISNCRI